MLIDVVDDAEFAITERNFRVIGRLHIGKGIRERGNPGYPDYEVIMFCSLTYAEQMFDLDPGMVNFCPMKVTIRDTGKEVVIATPLLPENFANDRMNKVTAKINRQLREIVEFARKDWLELYEKQQKP
ncbi:MAG: DUF302 domain-containing protein [Gammaproteobacteria bacterium]